MASPIETTYYLVAGVDAGTGRMRREPFEVYRYGPAGAAFWDPNDQTWNRSALAGIGRSGLEEDLLAGGGWVREVSGDDLARTVPNYDRAKFGA